MAVGELQRSRDDRDSSVDGAGGSCTAAPAARSVTASGRLLGNPVLGESPDA
jgi:hypothetical protein